MVAGPSAPYRVLSRNSQRRDPGTAGPGRELVNAGDDGGEKLLGKSDDAVEVSSATWCSSSSCCSAPVPSLQ